MFYGPGHFQTAFLARSYVWRPGAYTEGMEKCAMAFCRGSNELGWRGASEREQPGYPRNATWGADNINVACAANFASPGCPGPMAGASFTTAPLFETSIQLLSQFASMAVVRTTVSSGSETLSSTASVSLSTFASERVASSTTADRPSVTTSDGLASSIPAEPSRTA